uniref:Dicer-like protein 1 n=1 Tax=Heterorhabditis bacteriophora TaxID=37862 RepID=A0A1I7XT52_HETBA
MIVEKEVEKNCFTPRDYQVELLDKSCKRNTIVQLGTGAGKTFIAVLLIKEYALQLISPYEKGGKRALFIVNKGMVSLCLVEQQASHIACHTTLKVGKLHGNLNYNALASKADFENFIREFNVVVITAQVLVDIVSHAYLNLDRVAVLIFDECHHVLGLKHPYRVVMNRTTSTNSWSYGISYNGLIRIIFEYKQDSCRQFCSSTNEFNSNYDIDPRRPIQEALNRTLAVLKQVGPWAAWKVSQIWEKELKKLGKQSFLQQKAIDFLRMGETCMNTVKRILDPKMRPIKSLEALSPFLPHKVIRLLETLNLFSPDYQREHGLEESLCSIIFVDQRYVAYVMSVLLKHICRWEPRFKFIQPDFVIGYSGGSFASDDSQGLHKRQEDVMRRFRRGDLNLLVATNVLEEGVDVRHCNLVVKFDRPSDYRAYVQSKGRARKAGAKYVVLVDKSNSNMFSDQLRDFMNVEKILLRRYRTVHNPVNADVEDVDLLSPYVVPETGARVTMTTAIALVNRYCAKLPSDIFTRLVPESKIIPILKDDKIYYKAELLLPINSPIKQAIVLETPMRSKKLAQMAVALKVCRSLHIKGELNEYLLPVGRESIANLLCHLDEDPDEWAPGISAKVGSARRKQLYDKRVATALHDALPEKGKPCFIYVMELELIKEPSPESNPKRRKFANPHEYEYSFGFLSIKKLPQVPSFPAYLRQGDMRVRVVRAPTQVTLDSQTLTLIKHFHHYIFKDILQLCKGNLDFRVDALTPINTLIVPLNRVVMSDGRWDYSINMKYVFEVVQNRGDMPRIPDSEQRKHYKFRAEDYKDAVVMPWYRNVEQPVFYYVAEILTDMTPFSSFPDTDYTTFNEYFIKKYDLEIYDQEQNLLDVDFTSNRLNLLLPRASGAKKRIQRSAETQAIISSQRQIFVPELMDRHPISATLWNLISALPSFFYRINHLLLADELRERIMIDALGVSKVMIKVVTTL